MVLKLVLVRHGQSAWNLQNLFTGWRDPDLTQKGHEEAMQAGKKLKAAGLTFDLAYTSELRRARITCQHILDVVGQGNLSIIRDQALNERDYGDLSGMNKDEARSRWGEEQVHLWRRSYDVAPPGGESLRDTGARVWPYYIHKILPSLLRGQKVLIAAHGNSLRALIMVLEGLSREEIVQLELATGEPILYELNADSTLAKKTVL